MNKIETGILLFMVKSLFFPSGGVAGGWDDVHHRNGKNSKSVKAQKVRHVNLSTAGFIRHDWKQILLHLRLRMIVAQQALQPIAAAT